MSPNFIKVLKIGVPALAAITVAIIATCNKSSSKKDTSSKLIFSGQVIDKETYKGIDMAELQVVGRTELSYSESNGNFRFQISPSQDNLSNQVRVFISHSGYETINIEVTLPQEGRQILLTPIHNLAAKVSGILQQATIDSNSQNSKLQKGTNPFNGALSKENDTKPKDLAINTSKVEYTLKHRGGIMIPFYLDINPNENPEGQISDTTQLITLEVLQDPSVKRIKFRFYSPSCKTKINRWINITDLNE